MKSLSQQEGEYLLKLARNTIRQRLTGKVEELKAPEKAEVLQEERATFVTLKKRGQLRGCIGCLGPIESVEKSIVSNAINAAFHDHRFSPLTLPELDEVEIDISILTPTVKLDFTDSSDLVKKLKPGVDGVILKAGGRRATFLPQVWEQLPTAEMFLAHLCRKAGLPQDYWEREPVEVDIYHVQCFEEEGK